MNRNVKTFILLGAVILASCAKHESQEPAKPAAEVAAPPAAAAGGPTAVVHLKDGSKVSGTVISNSPTDMVVAGNDGIERKIPLTQIKSVEYGKEEKVASNRQGPARTERSAVPANQAPPPVGPQATQPSAPVPPPRVYELPVATQIPVRTNEAIDSGKANEGQTFDAQLMQDVKDADGTVVIPHGARASVVIKSASKGGKFHGASDLVLDLQSVVIDGRQFAIDTADVSQKGKDGVGANKRTAEHVGGGAALGAIIGAIAGGGKGAAIGAGAGAGAGGLTQVLTQGGAIRVPAESVLTFRLDKPLRVTAAQ